MGLFDFVRDIGKKVFGSDEEAGEKIKAEIESANPGVSDLDVQYEPQSGTVTLSGHAESAAAMQKAVLMAGNVEGVSQAPRSRSGSSIISSRKGIRSRRLHNASMAMPTHTRASLRRIAR
jgi:osmotically-inducible protein OsmY